jgi:DGQHR domain-containing protein
MEYFECVAIPLTQPSVTFYVSTVKPQDLETICRPLSRSSENDLFSRETSDPITLSDSQLNSLVHSLKNKEYRSSMIEILSEGRELPYQRFLDEKRAVQIARYLQQPSGLLPNAIILATNVNLDENDVIRGGGAEPTKIVLPMDPTSSVILDGQHRVAAFKYLDNRIRKNFQLLVVFLIGVPFYQQAELFAIINGKQKPVNRSIIYDLFGYAPIAGNREELLYEGLMAIAQFCSHVTRILNQVKISPWRAKVKMRGPGDVGLISQAAVVEYLSSLVEPKTYTKRLKVLPLLYRFFKDSDPAGCASLLILYLSAIQAALQNHWDAPSSLLWKNNGVAIILRIFHDDLLMAGSTENLLNGYKNIIERWKKAPPNDLSVPPKSGGGGIQNQLYEKFRAAMFTTREIEQLGVMREKAKNELTGIGGLIG